MQRGSYKNDREPQELWEGTAGDGEGEKGGEGGGGGGGWGGAGGKGNLHRSFLFCRTAGRYFLESIYCLIKLPVYIQVIRVTCVRI